MPLTSKKRLDVAYGVSKGLEYLHSFRGNSFTPGFIGMLVMIVMVYVKGFISSVTKIGCRT